MISKRSFLSGLAASAVAGPALAQMAPVSLAAHAKSIDAPI